MTLAEPTSWAEAGDRHMVNTGSCRPHETGRAMQQVCSGRRAACLLLLLCSVFALTATRSLAQSISEKPRVYPTTHRDISAPLREMKARNTTSVLKEEEAKEQEQEKQELEEMGHGGNQSTVAKLPWKTAEASSHLFQQLPGRRLQTNSGLNFDGISSNGWLAPDTNGAVGATQYVQYVNNQFAVYDKSTGNALYGPVLETALW